MNICSLTHTYPRFINDINGPFVETLMEHIARHGHDVSVLTAYDPAWNRKPDDHTVDLRTYKYIKPDSMHILGYSRTIEGNIRFRKRVLALSPFLFMGSFTAFLRLVREKKPDVLHAHWILPNGFIAGQVARITGVPLLIQLHGSDVFTAEKNPLFRTMARSAASNARWIISPSPDLKIRLGAIGIDTSKISLVPNTVEADFNTSLSDGDAENLRKELGIPNDHIIVLAVGRMVYVKGFNYLLEAFARIVETQENVTLVIAGGGVLYDNIKEMSEALGVNEQVRLPGPVSREEVPKYFSMADIAVVPSIKHESGAVDGLPVVVPEAMASGLPIVASNVGGISVLVKNDVTGVLVPERDPDSLARGILRLIEHPELRTKYGNRAKTVIEKAVNYDTISAHFVKVYESMTRNVMPDDMPQFVTPVDD